MNRPDFTVADLGELATLYTAEIAEGANVWVAAEGDYWTLEKNSGAVVSADVVAPGAGAPTAGATNARWLREVGALPFVLYRPRGGGLDDAPNIQALLALSPVALVRRASYSILSSIRMPNYSLLYGEGAVLHMNVPPVDGVTGAAFLALRSDSTGLLLALNANVVSGAYTFDVTTNPALKGCVSGAYVTLGDSVGNVNQSYLVVSVTGASPWTVHVDRPILIPYQAASSVAFASTQPTGIRIVGEGMQILATGGDRAIELAAAWYSSVSDVDIYVSGAGLAGFGATFDDGSYRSHMTNVTVDCGGLAIVGVASECSEECTMTDCIGINAKVATNLCGFLAYSGRNNEYRGCGGRQSPFGTMLDNTPYSSDGCKFFGGNNSFNTIAGVVLYGAQGWLLDGGTANNNASGLTFQTAYGNIPTSNTIQGMNLSDNSSYGINMINADRTKFVGNRTSGGADGLFAAAGITNTTVDAHRADGHSAWGVETSSDLLITNFGSSDCGTSGTGGAILQSGAARVTLDGFKIDATHGAGAYMLSAAGAGGIDATNGRISTSGAGVKIGFARRAVAGADSVSGVSIASAYGYYNDIANSTLTLGERSAITGTAAAFTMDTTTSVKASQSGITAQNATGAMTLAQLLCSSVQSSGNAAGTVTITASVLVPGMQWTFRNDNTGTSTTTFLGIIVAIGKTAVVRVNAAGAGERVTADT